MCSLCSCWTNITKVVSTWSFGLPVSVLSVCACRLSDHHCSSYVMLPLLISYFVFDTSWTNTKDVKQLYIKFRKVYDSVSRDLPHCDLWNWIHSPVLRSHQIIRPILIPCLTFRHMLNTFKCGVGIPWLNPQARRRPLFEWPWLLIQHTRWFKYDRDWFVCKQVALRSSCATLREWSHNLHPPSCSG